MSYKYIYEKKNEVFKLTDIMEEIFYSDKNTLASITKKINNQFGFEKKHLFFKKWENLENSLKNKFTDFQLFYFKRIEQLKSEISMIIECMDSPFIRQIYFISKSINDIQEIFKLNVLEFPFMGIINTKIYEKNFCIYYDFSINKITKITSSMIFSNEEFFLDFIKENQDFKFLENIYKDFLIYKVINNNNFLKVTIYYNLEDHEFNKITMV